MATEVTAMQRPDILSNLPNISYSRSTHTQGKSTILMEEPMEVEDYPHSSPCQGGTGVIMATPGGAPHTEEEGCSICLDSFNNKTVLPKCSHEFCKECIEQQFKYKPSCPICGAVYGTITGNQPPGNITIKRINSGHLPGYEQFGIIAVSYSFPDGTQTVSFRSIVLLSYLSFAVNVYV